MDYIVLLSSLIKKYNDSYKYGTKNNIVSINLRCRNPRTSYLIKIHFAHFTPYHPNLLLYQTITAPLTLFQFLQDV